MSLSNSEVSVASPALPLSDQLARLTAQAILIRSVEERLLDLFSRGKLFGTVHTCLGQEWSGVAVGAQLRAGDFVFSNHRCHGHYLARTDDVEGLIAEIMGKQTGVCGGRGGSQHLCRDGFFSNGIQGGIVPVAAGLAFAQRLRGTDNLTVVFIGDGTLGEGVVYETFNLASKWNLPLLIVLENNLYSQSTSQAETLAGEICGRAEAFGITASRSNTWQPESLVNHVAEVMQTIRRDQRPAFLQIDTYRLAAHSKGDDDRAREEVQRYRDQDPIGQFQQSYPDAAQQALDTANERIDLAVSIADVAAFANAVVTPTVRQTSVPTWKPVKVATPERGVTLICNALGRALERDERVVLVGEDIESPYGGAFKATKGLSHRFPGRVRNMPISEALIVGLGNGLALAGMIPVVEIMFGDFITLAADQLINHASKFRYMYNEQVQVPLVVRTPMGGRRGYGPTHSQSLEKHFLGLPDTLVLATNHRYDPGDLYDTLFATLDRPTLVIENKSLYGQRVDAVLTDGFVLEHDDERFPTTRIRPEGAADVTIVCYGEMLREVESAIVQAFDEHEVICEVICPAQLYPLSLSPIVESVARSGRLLVIEEGIGFAGFGAEVIAQVQESKATPAPSVRRLASQEHPIPACAPLEKMMLPHAASIVQALLEMMSHG